MKIDRRYVLDTLIGEGGMASVYLAEDIILGRKVAVKILHQDLAKQDRFVLRFRREAEAVSSLIHPNIVEIYDVGEQDNTYFIVMELLEGETLKEHIKKKGSLSVAETIAIMKQACIAVDLAHANGIIHRDLKPQNIFIREDGTIKIMDFGIAYQKEASPLTQTNAVMGSVHYLAPEQAKGDNATIQTDIYSLGIVMYEMLTGQVPFSGESAVNIVLKHLRERIPYVKTINPHVPQSVENIIIKATAKNTENRYHTLGEVEHDLDTCLDVSRMNEPRLFFMNERDKTDATDVMDEKKLGKEQPLADEEQKKKEKKKKMIIISSIVAAFVLILGGGLTAKFLFDDPVMPDLIGRNKEAAITILKNLNIQYEEVYEANETIPANQIIKTNPIANKKVKKNIKVQLLISKGKSVIMTDLVGTNFEDAKTVLDNQGIKYEVETKITSIEKPGTILEQSILAGNMVFIEQDVVKFVIAEQEIIILENLENKSFAQAEAYATSKGLKLNVKEEFSEFVNQGVIIRMEGSYEGQEVAIGTTITIVVSKGKEPTPEPATNNQENLTTNNQTATNETEKPNKPAVR